MAIQRCPVWDQFRNILCGWVFVGAYAAAGPPKVTTVGRPHIDKAVLKRATLRGASIGLAAVLSGALHKESHALSFGVKEGVVTGLSSGILVSVAPAVEAWADDLPDRRLGGYGAILVLIGSLLQALQYGFPLFGLPAM